MKTIIFFGMLVIASHIKPFGFWEGLFYGIFLIGIAALEFMKNL